MELKSSRDHQESTQIEMKNSDTLCGMMVYIDEIEEVQDCLWHLLYNGNLEDPIGHEEISMGICFMWCQTPLKAFREKRFFVK